MLGLVDRNSGITRSNGLWSNGSDSVCKVGLE